MSKSIKHSRRSDNRSSVNREAKSLLAKLLSTEDIRVVHSATVCTATWSGRTKTLTLPIWKEMSGDIYDMLVCHEVGHVLYTPDENSREVNAAVKRLTGGKNHLKESAFGFLNICEDTRIERKMKSRYPGSRRSFTRGYQWIKDTGTWQLPSDPNSMKFIDRVNTAAKLGPLFPVTFNSEEQILVDRLATVNSFTDMVVVAEAMYRLAQKQKKDEQPDTPDQPQEPQDGDGEPQSGEGDAPQPGDNREQQDGPANTDIPNDPDEDGPKDTRSSDDDTDDGEGADSTDGDGDSDGKSSDGKSDRNKPEDKDESSDTDADGKSSDGDDSNESDSQSGDGDDSADGDSDSDTDGDADGDADGSSKSDDDGDTSGAADSADGSKGDENDIAPDAPETTSGIEDAIKNLVDRNATARVYVNVPKLILKNIIEDHKDLHKSFASEVGNGYEAAVKKALKDLTAFEKEAKPVVNVMAKRFDMKKAADQHRRAMTAKTGRINPDMLHAYKLTEDIFLRQTRVPHGKNHGLVMFIDWSGSMDNIISKTLKQMMNLALFCRRVGIPFEVFGFSDSDRCSREAQIAKEGDFELGSLKLHNWLSGRMSAREFKRASLHIMMLIRHWTPAKNSGRYSYSRRYRSSSINRFNLPYRFNLGGTPLDDAIVAAMEIVPAFQKGNDVQIVNTIFLTDGCSSRSPIFSGASHGDDIVVHDPVTRNDHRLADFDENTGGLSYYGSKNSTAMLLSMLRDRTDANVIGFYLLSKYRGSKYQRSDIASNMGTATCEIIDREWKRFQTDKFAVAESMGYDEYYLIPGDQDAVTEALATGSAESFTKMSRSKRVNRVLLNRFVDLVAQTA